MEFWGFNWPSDACVKKSHHHDTAERVARSNITAVVKSEAAKCRPLLTFHSVGKKAASQETGGRNAGKQAASKKRTDETDQSKNIVQDCGD